MKQNNTNNGCGACTGWVAWIRPPHARFFKNECILHDELYSVGGTEADRLRADRRLFVKMIDHALTHYQLRKPLSLYWFATLALAYYGAVRLFGRGQFRYTNKPLNTNQL